MILTESRKRFSLVSAATFFSLTSYLPAKYERHIRNISLQLIQSGVLLLASNYHGHLLQRFQCQNGRSLSQSPPHCIVDVQSQYPGLEGKKPQHLRLILSVSLRPQKISTIEHPSKITIPSILSLAEV